MRRWHVFVCCRYDDFICVVHWPFYLCSRVARSPEGDPASRHVTWALWGHKPKYQTSLIIFPTASEVRCSRMLPSTQELRPSPTALRGHWLNHCLLSAPAFIELHWSVDFAEKMCDAPCVTIQKTFYKHTRNYRFQCSRVSNINLL